MRRLRAVHVRAALALASVLPTFAVDRALAQACGYEACGPGYACETSTGVNCYPSCYADAGVGAGDASARDAGALPALPFDDGGKPPLGDGGWDPCWSLPLICEPYEYRYCAPALCTVNADCPSNMVCHTNTWQECSGGSWPCKPGSECQADGGWYGDGGEYTCSEHSESRCTLRINLPCQADADCGDNYECVENRWYGCSGGGSVTPDGDAGYTYEDAGSVCDWYSSGSYCRLLELPCEDDSVCPDDMRCQPSYAYPPCNGSEAGVGSGDAGGRECPPPVVSTTCQPWYGGPWGDAGVDGGSGTPPSGSTGGGTAGGGGSVGGAPSSDAGVVGAVDAGSSGGGHQEEDDQGHHGGGLLRRLLRHVFGAGGCSVPGSPAQGNLGWLSVLALGLLARRRRS